MGFEENTRHTSEDRLVSSGFQSRMKQNALFPRVRSDSKTDSNVTGISCAATPQHFIGSRGTLGARVALNGLLGVVGGSWRRTVGKICCQIAVKRRNIPDTNTLKPPYKGLEQFGGPSILFGMPKGGLDTPCPLVSAPVLPVLERAPYCPSCVGVFR